MIKTPKQKGYVYIIKLPYIEEKLGFKGVYKIGFSTDVNKRFYTEGSMALSTLYKGIDETIIIGPILNFRVIEKKLHKLFALKRWELHEKKFKQYKIKKLIRRTNEVKILTGHYFKFSEQIRTTFSSEWFLLSNKDIDRVKYLLSNYPMRFGNLNNND